MGEVRARWRSQGIVLGERGLEQGVGICQMAEEGTLVWDTTKCQGDTGT